MARKRITRRTANGDFTAAQLRQRVDYNAQTGEFTRRPYRIGTVQHFGKTRVPAVTLRLQANDGVWRHYYAHRLAWLWMTGKWPAAEIDHINNVSTDNRWSNLREATHAQNNRNKSFASTRNGSGLIGAHYHRRSGLWRATLRHKTLGYFKTAEEAHEVYKKAAAKIYGVFAHQTLTKVTLK